MKIFHLPNIYVIGKSEKHLEIKKQLLNLIDTSPYVSFNGVSKTDYNVDSKITRPYADLFFFEILKPFIEQFCVTFNGQSFEVYNFWFQQYHQGSSMRWHVHPKSNYTGVYYLEYPHDIKTEILDLKTKKIIPLETITEGDFLIFPTNLVHRAPTNTEQERKTIISFNFDILEYNEFTNIR